MRKSFRSSVNGLLKGCAVVATLLGVLNGAKAQEESSRWKRTGELTGRSFNPAKAFSDARLLKKNVVSIAFDPNRFDPSRPVRFEVRPAVKVLEIEALDVHGRKVPFKIANGGSHVEVRAGEAEFRPFDGASVAIGGRSQEDALARLTVKFDADDPVQEVEMFFIPAGADYRANMAPAIAKPQYQPWKRAPEVVQGEGTLAFKNGTLEALFNLENGLRLVSLRNAYTGRNVLLNEGGLFLIDTGNGRSVSAKDWVVEKVDVAGLSAKVHLQGAGLAAVVALTIDAEELRAGLEVINTSEKPAHWKTVFPHLEGVTISKKAEGDYYLFPYYGGIVQTVDANLRFFYGGNEALWQMVDIFSPEGGTGLSVHCLDETGRIKGVAFRKGKNCPPFASHISNLYKRLPEGSYWQQSLTPGEGSSLGFEYSRYERAPGKSFVYPEVAIRMHEGDWHTAMRRYSDWAHAVWKGQPIVNRLNDVWDILSVIASTPTERIHQKQLYDFKKDEWYAGYRKDGLDMAEFRHWWKWSEKGPFGVDLSKGKADVLKQMHNRWSYFFYEHPKSGQLLSVVNDGDYDYNPLMGGLDGLKKGIAAAHEGGALVQFYTDPFIVDSTTNMGQNYGRKFSVVNDSIAHTPGQLPESPKNGHVMTYAKWSMCTDVEEYQQIFAKNMARLVRDTQVDGIRMDQMGYTGMTCFSKDHTHKHAEPGEHAVLQSMKTLVDAVRTACVAEKPDILLTAEYPGADYLARQLDGALTYELAFWSRSGFRPLPTNILRFYFPELKCYENPAGYKGANLQEVALWNGMGLFQRIWKPEYDRILKENSDAFRSTDVTPLIPTLAEFVYGNRFATGGKEITVFYNSRKEAFAGPLLAVDGNTTSRYFDLLNGKELTPEKEALHLRIEPDKVGVVARFEKKLILKHGEAGWSVALDGVAAGESGKGDEGGLLFCNAAGAVLSRVPLPKAGEEVALPENARVQIVKLVRGRYTADIVALPIKD